MASKALNKDVVSSTRMPESKIAKRNSDVMRHSKDELRGVDLSEKSKEDFLSFRSLCLHVIAPAVVVCAMISFGLVVAVKECKTKKKKGQIQGRNIHLNESQNTKWISVDWNKGTIEDEEPKGCSGDDTKNAVEI